MGDSSEVKQEQAQASQGGAAACELGAQEEGLQRGYQAGVGDQGKTPPSSEAKEGSGKTK